VIGLNEKCYSVIQYIKDSIKDKIQNWLLNKFLEKTKVSKIAATAILSLASFDILYIIKYILSIYGLNYLFKYIVFIVMM
jgi:hypothetical protein